MKKMRVSLHREGGRSPGASAWGQRQQPVTSSRQAHRCWMRHGVGWRRQWKSVRVAAPHS